MKSISLLKEKINPTLLKWGLKIKELK